MNDKQKHFIEFVDYLLENCKAEMPEDVEEFYNLLKTQNSSSNKPLLTESGMEILAYLQSCDAKNLKAKDIADGMGISSRKVSGSIRKLVTDNFVDKFGNSPVVYTLTEKGKEFDLESYKGEMNNV